MSGEIRPAQGPTLTTSYTYDLAGHITRITYPSGRVVNTVHTGGLPSSITSAPTASGVAAPLLSNIDFNPFAGPRRWDWNMDAGLKADDRVFDLSGRMVRYPLGPLVRDLVYDAADRITSFTHYDTAGKAQSAFNQGFTYDVLGRLTSSTGTSATRTYVYDANGNRTTATIGTTVQTYATDKASNRVTSVSNPNRTLSYDNAGNIASDIAAGSGANYTGTYSLEGRLAQMSQGSSGVAFAYDALGQRVGRVSWAPRGTPGVAQPSIIGGGQAAPDPVWAPIPTGSARTAANFYVYDLEGHLIGSYNSSGGAYAEYIWLEDTPVAVYEQVATSVGAVSTQLFYVHADHIDTPRVLQDTQGNTRWRWMAEPFGTTAPEEQPTASLPAVTFNLRMPGQQFEPFGGRFYNYFRDYEPSTGRYVQSDPIGLDGGLNTYAYAGGQPTSMVDRKGLFYTSVDFACAKDPSFCAEIMGQTIRNAGTISGNKCLEADANRAANRVENLAAVLAMATLFKTRPDLPEITLSRRIHGEAAEHAADAIAAGKPSILTIDRAGAAANRQAAIGALEKVPGKHLDEFPPAMFREGGARASVRPITPRDNLSGGACIGNACRGLPDGARVRIKIED